MRHKFRLAAAAAASSLALIVPGALPANADALLGSARCYFTSTAYTPVQVARADSGSYHRVTELFMGTYTVNLSTGQRQGNAEGIVQAQIIEQNGSYVNQGAGENWSFSPAAYGYQDLSTTTTEFPWRTGTQYAWWWLRRNDGKTCTARIRMY